MTKVRLVDRVPLFQPIGSVPGCHETIEALGERVAARQPSRHPGDTSFDGCVLTESVTVEVRRGENGAVHRGTFTPGPQFQPEPTREILIVTMPFGQHRGAAWHEIPRAYLEWVLQWSPPDVVESIRAFLGFPEITAEEE